MDAKIRKIVMTAVLAALTFAATMVIRIPVPVTGGYVHPGDGFVILAGAFVGPVYGFLAAAIGSALADVVGEYLVYAPATFVIKGLAALAAALVFGKWRRMPGLLAGGLLAAAVVVLGYFLFEGVLYGFPAAAVAMLPNLVQGLVGVGIAALLNVRGLVTRLGRQTGQFRKN